MTNARYLIISYFFVGAACLVLAVATYALLRRSFATLSADVPGGKLGLIFRKLFFPGLVLPALTGFLAVTFQSCDKTTYDAIIADRSYLIAKNQEQLSTSMSYLGVALLVWCLVVALGFLTVHKRS